MRNISPAFVSLLSSLLPCHIDCVTIDTTPLTKYTLTRPQIKVHYVTGRSQRIRLGKFLKKYTTASDIEVQNIVEHFKGVLD